MGSLKQHFAENRHFGLSDTVALIANEAGFFQI